MSARLRTRFLLLLGATLIGTTAWRVWRLDHGPPRFHRAVAAPNADGVVDLRQLDGRPAALALAGPRPKVVHVWASWCAPCVAELPVFAAIAPELQRRGIDLVLVALDEPADAQDVLDREHLALSTLVASDAATGQLFAIGSSSGAVPFSILFNTTGRNVRQHVGAVEGGAGELLEWVDGARRTTAR